MKPGRHNAITDVPGVLVGHWQRHESGWATGTTVVLVPDGAVGAVDGRGGAPGTRETDLLAPHNLVQQVHAVCLSGGSAYGLAAADGVMRWLSERNHGFPVGLRPHEVVPIVPAAVLFDLPHSEWGNRPDAESGYAACTAAAAGPVAMGTIGAGTGAKLGSLKGGIGTASVVLANSPGDDRADEEPDAPFGGRVDSPPDSAAARGFGVAATGAPGDPAAGRFGGAAARGIGGAAAGGGAVAGGTSGAGAGGGAVAGGTSGAGAGGGGGAVAGGTSGAAAGAFGDELAGPVVGALVAANAVGEAVDARTGRPWAADLELAGEFGVRWPDRAVDLNRHDSPLNTTIGVVATDVRLTKAQARRLAMAAQDGLVRAVRPAHSMFDGDTVFALATGTRELTGGPAGLDRLCAAAADVFARAMVHALLAAESIPGLAAFRDVWPESLSHVGRRGIGP